MKEAIERSYNAIIEKNPSLTDKEETAKKVGVGAIIFHDLFNQRIKNVDFSWKEVLNFDGMEIGEYEVTIPQSIVAKVFDL